MKNKIPLAITLILALSTGSCGAEGPDRNPEGVALAGVPGGSATRLIGDTTVVVRRVWEGPDVGLFEVSPFNSPSPDGRYITMSTEAGSLGRIDLLTGKVLPIKKKGTWSEAQEWTESAVFSPDGREVAYVYWSNGYEIRISGVDGSDERTILGPEGLVYAMIFAWQEDEIIAWFFPDGPPGAELVGISPVDGTVRVIRVFGADWYETERGAPLVVSPDGDFLTYGIFSPQGDADVVILRATDGAEVDRVEGPANDIAVAWTPDGAALLFHSDRQMTEGIWRVRIDGGRIAGEPDLVRGDLWNSVPIGPSRDAYFFGVKTDVRRVRVAAFDPETGMMLSEPTAVSGVITEPSRAPIWSPDGQAMAYVKDGPPNLTAEGLEGSILVVRSLFGPDAREIPLHGKKLMDLLAWTSDGTIVGSGLSGEQRNAYAWSIDLESGRIDTLVGGNEPLPRALSPDGRTHYYFREDGHAMVAMDSATRRERTVVEFGTEHGAERFYLSPDGKTLAFILVDPNTGNSVLAVAPASGGSLRELFRRAVPDGISTSMGVFWAPNRDQLFFSTHGVPDTDEPERIWKVDYSEAEPEVTEVQGAEGLKGAEDLVIHPESSRIAFVGGEERSEIWMMTNLGGGGH